MNQIIRDSLADRAVQPEPPKNISQALEAVESESEAVESEAVESESAEIENKPDMTMTRKQLNRLASQAGVSAPHHLPNKQAVIDAIEAL